MTSSPTDPTAAAPSDAPAPETVSYDEAGGVVTIGLQRPKAFNGLDIATKEALLAALTRAGEDESVRCVVLTGSGRSFSAGQDLKEHVQLLDSGGSDQLFSTVDRHYNPIVKAIASMPKPVVAAVNGVAAGAGASLALACDFRVVAESAGFNFAFAGVALSCDTGSSWTLPRIVGRAKALELLYFPRTVPSAESLELGLATQVVPDDQLTQTVAELTGRLVAGPTVAYGAIRRSVEFSGGHSFEDSLEFESSMMTLTGATQDHRGAVDAFVAKEKPTYRGR